MAAHMIGKRQRERRRVGDFNRAGLEETGPVSPGRLRSGNRAGRIRAG